MAPGVLREHRSSTNIRISLESNFSTADRSDCRDSSRSRTYAQTALQPVSYVTGDVLLEKVAVAR
jgi:hypothetical protein